MELHHHMSSSTAPKTLPVAGWINDYFEASGCLVALLEPNGRVINANRLAPARKTSRAGNIPLADFFADDACKNIRQWLTQAAHGQPVSVEAVAGPRCDGTPGWYQLELTPVNGHGKIHSLLAVATDITTHKQEQERLRRTESMMVDTQGVAHLGIWDWDITRPHAVWSPELYRIYRLDPKTHVPTYEDYLTRVHPDDRARVEAATNGAFHELKPYSHDERIYRADGSLCYLHTWAFPVTDENGKLLRLTGVCQDITERKLAENALAEHAAELARSNAQLEQYARVISHDLQEPLRAIASFVQLLEVENKGQLGDFSDEAIGYIVDGVHRMKRLINDLLEYSQASSVKRQNERVSLSQVLASVEHDIAGLTADMRGSIKPSPLPDVEADEQQVYTLFKHLLVNALTFHGSKPPDITISAKPLGNMVQVTVADNGCGIDPKHHERVFVVFQRLNPDQPGTGIGLALCKAIVERHGGRIWLESEPGLGTRIHFSLPSAKPRH